MARPVIDVPVILKVEYIPVPEDKVNAWRAGILLLLNLIYEEKEIFTAEKEHEHKRLDSDGRSTGIRPALFSLANVAQKETAKAGGIRAWFVGHDGSAHIVAYGSR